MADGSIVFETALDNKTLEKELSQLNKRLQRLNDQVYSKQQQKMPLISQSKELAAQLDIAKAKLSQMQSQGVGSDKLLSQKETVQSLQSQWDSVQSKIESYDKSIASSNTQLDLTKSKIGAISAELMSAEPSVEKMETAAKKVEKSSSRFALRLREVIRSALVFTVISQGFAQLREWIGKVIKSNDEAVASIARLKGAFLTLAQPIINVVIPALISFLNILANVVNEVSKLVSRIFGTTASESAKAAESLYNQTNAIESVGSAADEASKSLAGFDEINQLSGESSGGGGGGGGTTSETIAPDFSMQENWLEDTLGKAAGWVTAALILGGIALIAIGASIGSLKTVIAGLLLIGAGVYVGEETGVLQAWAEALGLEGASEFVTAALLIGGIALIALGAATGNLLAVLAGLVLLGSGVAVGVESGTIQNWADALGLDSVFDYVEAGMILAGIALIAIGAAMANVVMVVTGGILLSLGVAADIIGEETLSNWWDVLKLTRVQQWVSVALLLGGIALVAIGAATANILMVLGGMALIGFGSVIGTQNGNLKDWVTVLGLEKAAKWVTAGLLVGGLALVVFGIVTANMPMVLAGLGLLGAGITVGITSGTFQSWLDSILGAFTAFSSSIQDTFNDLWDGVKSVINSILGGIEWMANGVVKGINTVINALNKLSFDIPDWVPELGGKTFGFDIPTLNEISIPRLAQGAVIPPNREFMAVLGDQKSGTNIETPLETMIQAFRQALSEMNTGRNEAYLVLDEQILGKVVYRLNNNESKRVGVKLTGV